MAALAALGTLAWGAWVFVIEQILLPAAAPVTITLWLQISRLHQPADGTRVESGDPAAAAPTPSPVGVQPTGPRDQPAALRQGLHRAQLLTYLAELRDVLPDPLQPGRSQAVEADPAVEELVILRDRADPGLLVFSPELAQAGSGRRKSQAVLGVEVSDQHEDLALAGDQLLITALRVRGPVLLLLGVIAPLLALLLRFRHRIVRLTL